MYSIFPSRGVGGGGQIKWYTAFKYGSRLVTYYLSLVSFMVFPR